MHGCGSASIGAQDALAPAAAASVTSPSLGRTSELPPATLSAALRHTLHYRAFIVCQRLSLEPPPRGHTVQAFLASNIYRCRLAGLQVPGVPCRPRMDRERGPHDLPVLWAGSRARQVRASKPLQVALLRAGVHVPPCSRLCQCCHHGNPLRSVTTASPQAYMCSHRCAAAVVLSKPMQC